ncbi:MAG: alpha/beta hydrolase [Planctomycetota bacterium]|nr:MAG: alpha/beta hydrolase [Planctomycetota bacterium]REJ88101.1 MAG: alpha/beta hydrolase [Planctomycetota bacterium]REK21716.1 MAG: alpha/beta hydrolase [Planctomycetota bacterium]REK43122.1 MAG: alpha/beta hydrolase [Planctomycetota bacterium]
MRSSIWRLARSLAIAYLVVLLLAMIFEERFIFIPRGYDGGANWNPDGLHFEDVFFTAADGTQLHGWYCPVEEPRAVILFAHGNAGNLSNRAPVVRKLQHYLDATVMLFDYRGYGRSEGRPHEAGVLQDARAARAWLARRAGVEEQEIVLVGRSLGGAVMVDLAAGDGAHALVLESTFTSIPEVAALRFPFLPVRTLIRNRFDSLAKIERYGGPLFQSHGDADQLIPYEFGRTLHEAAVGPKEFFTLPFGGHNDAQPDEYYLALNEFLGGLTTRSSD